MTPPPAGSEPAAIELRVSASEAGERIDRMLSARPLGYSRSTLQSWIAEGRVLLDGRKVRASARCAEGMQVLVQPGPPPPSEAVPEDLPLQLLFEDEHLAVLNKAAGMVVHPAPGHWSGTLVNALRFHLEVKVGDPERPGIVHRLDRDTSGVMVVARSERAREGLIAQWKRHAIEREYVAIAQGEPPEQLRIETLHGRDPKHRKRFTSRVTSGKPAITELRVLSRLSGASLVSCTLQTGRTHQIRMHLSERGYPLLADALYGRPSKDPRIARAAEAIGRQALHARLLGFVHPVSEQALRFICDPPADFERALAVLREG